MDPKRNTGAPGAGAGRGGIGVGGTGSVAARPGAAGAVRRPAGPPAAAPRLNVQEALDQLGRSIQQLRIDYERFFNGALPIPPEELRNRILAQFRQLRNANLAAAVDNFRLADLEARFNTYGELFNRRLREREEGRHIGRAAADHEAPRFDVEKGVLVADAVEAAAAEALYVGLCQGGGEAPRFDLASFQTYIERQTAAIRERTGCAQVQFRLAAEDGKLRLKARPVQ